jgi:hypothetical protein
MPLILTQNEVTVSQMPSYQLSLLTAHDFCPDLDAAIDRMLNGEKA